MQNTKERGAKLRDLRRQKGLSQWAVARAVGKTQGWLSAIELGYVMPSDEVALDIMAAIRQLDPPASNHGANCAVVCEMG